MARRSIDLKRFSKFSDNAIKIALNGLYKHKYSAGIIDVDCQPASKQLEKSLEYNLSGGKMSRGMVASQVFLLSAKDSRVSEEDALVLGWAMECLQTCFLVVDDIMDSSVTRRGRACWYKNQDVGLMAINDALSIEMCVYILLRSLPDYVPVDKLVELFEWATIITEMGQTLDMQNSECAHVDLSHFTEDTYSAIVKYKTSVYSFYLPIASGLVAAGQDSNCSQLKEITLQMGHYFQAQDDFIDCFGNPEVTGKIGTDIQDNKCSWLVVEALKYASQKQRQLIKDNYGKKNEICVERIKELYSELNLETCFKNYEQESLDQINDSITKYSGPLDTVVFKTILKKLYKREC